MNTSASASQLSGNHTILIIDDNPNNLGVIAEYLETCGCRVLVARDGEGGIARASYARPDLILLDVMMPGLDGFETCRRLKDRAETRDIPVIFMTALTSIDDKVRGFEVGAVDYVTKPIQHEEVRARIMTHLRIRQLNEQLQRTNQELNRINADKDRFFSIVAHDLRGLFLPLLGNAELLSSIADDVSPAEIKEISDGIHRSGRLALDLLEHLLEWARLRMGHLQHQPAHLNLNAVTSETMELLLHQASQNEIQLANQVPLDLRVFADGYMLATALRNLITNAMKYTQAGGQVSISARLQQDGNLATPMILVSVSDNGIGMDEEQCAQIFEPLSQHQSRPGVRAERGTGLGLVICKEVIARNGGEIRVVSSPGKGTTFTFSVPAAADLPDGTLCGSQARATNATTVLIVDPNQASRHASTTALEPCGYHVLTAADEHEVVQLISRYDGSIDVLLTEVMLANENGAMLAARLVERYPDMHVLFTSSAESRITELIARRQEQNPGIAFLLRPYDAATLQVAVANLLRGQLALARQ